MDEPPLYRGIWDDDRSGVAPEPAHGYKSRQRFAGDQEAGVAQPQHGSMRSEVSDLQNIVDRLDLLMGSSAEASTESPHGISESSRERLESSLADLADRVGALERETEELRTLVNHLMTIATWQAKVTATLVGEDEAAESAGAKGDAYSGTAGQERHAVTATPERRSVAAGEERSLVDRVAKHVEPRRPDAPRMPRRPPTTLDDDIDDILGTDREAASDDSPPPDFGI